MTPVAKRNTALALARSTAVNPRMVLNVTARVTIHRKGTLWAAVVRLDTPLGPLRFAAQVDEQLIFAWLAQRAQKAGGVETAGLFDGLKKAARSIAQKLSVKRAVESVKKVVKDPISAAALKLPTLPGPLGRAQRKAMRSAGNLLKRALGGEKRAAALLAALKQSAMAGVPGPAKAWNTVRRVYRSVKRGSPTNLLRDLGSEVFRQTMPAQNLLRAVETQTQRLPGPLGAMANQALNAVPGVGYVRAVNAAQAAFDQVSRGRVPSAQNLRQVASWGQTHPAQTFSGREVAAPPGVWPDAYAPYPYTAWHGWPQTSPAV